MMRKTGDHEGLMGTIAISGSASGIGAATRAMLEAEGHTVIGIDLRDAEVIADLSTDEGRRSAVADVAQRCGDALDGFVSGAGLGPPAPATSITEVNYFGSQNLLEGLRPALAATSGASVVQIGSNSTTITPNVPDARRSLSRKASTRAVSRSTAPWPMAQAKLRSLAGAAGRQ